MGMSVIMSVVVNVSCITFQLQILVYSIIMRKIKTHNQLVHVGVYKRPMKLVVVFIIEYI